MYALEDFLFGVLHSFGVFSTALGKMAGARQILGNYAIAAERSRPGKDDRIQAFRQVIRRV
jgi:hypothetical protein